MEIGKLEHIDIVAEAKKAYLDYAMSVIVSRALPDIRDGLKPVHRRILFAMNEMNLYPSAKYSKSAKIVGETMGKFHPHGDMAIYDSLVRLAQDFSMRYPLVDGQGNFGSMDGDSAAAMRYCVTGDTLVVTNKGLLPIKSLSLNNAESISYSVLSKDRVINKASKWFDSGKHKTIKIQTNQGFTLQGTYNHPMLTWTRDANGKPMFEWKLLNQVKKGDFAVLDRTNDALWPKEGFNLSKFYPTKIPPRTQIKILPKKMTKELAFILGALVSEGTIHQNELEFCNSDAIWMESFKNCWQKTFPDCRLHEFSRKPSSYGKKPYYTFEIHSRHVIAFLRGLGLTPEKAAQKSVPHIILSSSKEEVAEFLKAYFEGDGSISSTRKMVELSCCSVSEKLIQELQILLLRFGIVSTKRFDTHRTIHKLYIRGLRNYNLFFSQIGFFSDRKNSRLEEIINSSQKDQSILDYVPFLKEYVYQNLDPTLNYTYYRGFVQKHNFDRYSNLETHSTRVASSVIESLKPEIQNLFKKLLEDKYIFDSIEKIEDGGLEQVYSIKVDSTCHSFVANGFINHNTEAKLTPLAMEMLFDIDKQTVEFTDNFDGTIQEPVYLPSKLPNLLLMGGEGIAVGMATKIPPHNLKEVIDACVYTIDHTKYEKPQVGAEKPAATEAGVEPVESLTTKLSHLSSEVEIDDLLNFIQGPDFPTGGAIYDINEIKNVYRTGRGKILIRGIANIEEIGQGKSAIIITEIPYQVNKSSLVAKIAELAKLKRLEGITDLRDESDRRGIRVVVELKRDVTPKKILNNLFKLTALQTSFPANCVCLVDGVPKTVNLKIMLDEYIKHRFSVITKRSEFELAQAKARIHILDGLIIAVNNIDEVVEIIKKSKDTEDARKNLMERFTLSEIQATAILDMQLRRLSALEIDKLQAEWNEVKKTIDYLESLLADPLKLLQVVRDELVAIRDKYQDARRTKVYKSKVDEFSEEDLIQNEPTVITISQTGYIKRQNTTSFKTQARGGKGVMGMKTKDEDSIEHILFAETHDHVLFFTNLGKVYATRVYEIAEGSRVGKGQAIVNVIDVSSGEKIESIMTFNPKSKKDAKFVFLATKKGTVKKTSIDDFNNIRRNGIIAIKLDKTDQLIWVRLSQGVDDVVLVTKKGKIISFKEDQVRQTGRASQGVRGIKIGADDEVVSMDLVSNGDRDAELLVVAENGLGKRTKVSGVRNQNRGGQGVKIANLSAKTGDIIFSSMIPKNSVEVIITSQKGQVVKIPLKSVPILSRNAQGVILMRFSDKADKVVSAALITEDEQMEIPVVKE